jgi:hypothetical protein
MKRRPTRSPLAPDSASGIANRRDHLSGGEVASDLTIVETRITGVLPVSSKIYPTQQKWKLFRKGIYVPMPHIFENFCESQCFNDCLIFG